MATETNQFLTRSAGKTKLGIGISESSGVGDADKLIATGSDGKIDSTLMPAGVAADTVVAPASENLSAGDWVNLWNDGGTLKVRKADATTAGKEADGFVLTAVTAPANATVYREGTNSQQSGLTIGAEYWLSTTAGQPTNTSPVADGNVSQFLGKAKSATELCYVWSEPIEIDIV